MGASKKSSQKLPQELVPFNSEDKDYHQKEDLNDRGNFPSPVICCIFGNVNCGKSRTIKNVLCHKTPHYERIVIYTVLNNTQEYKTIDHELVDEVPSLDFFDPEVRNCLIFEDISPKELSKKGTEQYIKIIKAWCKSS